MVLPLLVPVGGAIGGTYIGYKSFTFGQHIATEQQAKENDSVRERGSAKSYLASIFTLGGSYFLQSKIADKLMGPPSYAGIPKDVNQWELKHLIRVSGPTLATRAIALTSATFLAGFIQAYVATRYR